LTGLKSHPVLNKGVMRLRQGFLPMFPAAGRIEHTGNPPEAKPGFV